jgi:S-DNA-T family DNA segregation ATPase FtsK/SpoIIIE
MAKKGKGRQREPRFNVDPARQREIVGIALIAAGGLTLLSIFSADQGPIFRWWIDGLRRTFGWGYLLAPIGMAGAGVWLVLDSLDQRPDVGWEQPLGGLVLYLALLTGLHLVAGGNQPAAVADQGRGGGYVGLWISQVLLDSVGGVGAFLVLLAVFGIGLVLLLGRSTVQLIRALVEASRRVGQQVPDLRLPDVRLNPPPALPGESLASRVLDRMRDPLGLSRGLKPPVQAAPATPPGQPDSPGAPPVSPPATLRSFMPRIIGGGREWRLPIIGEIFEENIEQELSQSEIRTRVRIIEDTLVQFGVPAKVVEVSQGPTVTQFGVEPGFVERRDQRGRLQKVKVKVSRIASLSNDLALALAAAPIRIEAPVPGRSVVGIEVPNSETHLVGLRGVMESDVFGSIKGPLPLALGRDVSGLPVAYDLAMMPHLLIAGATGSGKSVCINAIIACLISTHTPDDLKLLMIDPKRVELVNFNGIPHLAAPVVVDLERVMSVLQWATGEMDRRYKLFARAGTRNIEAYNQAQAARNEPKLPYLVLIVDELADLMMLAQEEVERRITRLAQMARATGVHLIIATQRPSVDVVTGLIKANFPARISFAVTSQVDSRVILDVPGAEKLLGRGDMLFMAPDASKLQRLQGCYVSDRELDRLVRFWKGMGPPLPGARPGEPATAESGAVVQQPLWEGLAAQVTTPGRQGEEEDDLYPRAVEVVREAGSASVSLLQRRLRIGYSRAARLIDLMEERGIVGPSEGANKPRPVLKFHDETGRQFEISDEEADDAW